MFKLYFSLKKVKYEVVCIIYFYLEYVKMGLESIIFSKLDYEEFCFLFFILNVFKELCEGRYLRVCGMLLWFGVRSRCWGSWETLFVGAGWNVSIICLKEGESYICRVFCVLICFFYEIGRVFFVFIVCLFLLSFILLRFIFV